LACGLVVAAACGQVTGTLDTTITEGERFAHAITFPSRFRVPDNTAGRRPLLLDHYAFRISGTSPDVLLVAACTNRDLLEVCSPNSFAIDTAHSYSVQEVGPNDWDAAKLAAVRNMYSPLPEKPYHDLAPIDPSFGRGGEYEGYKYRGNEYRRRGDWIVNLSFGGSEDGKLVVLAGVDKRQFRNQDPGLISSAINTGFGGLVAIDVFGSDPSRRLAALDLDCHTNVNVARRRISLVNSRWLAIGLEVGLQKMLLLDFRTSGGQTK
jgi:hypothetical protein